MGATTRAAFDPKPIRLGTVIDTIAGVAIYSGDVVAFKGTSTEDWTVYPCDNDETGATGNGAPIGVALYSQATVGGKVAVAGYGSVVLVRNALDGTAIDAGTTIVPGTTAGMVIAGTAPNAGGADCYHIGKALTGDAAGGATFYILINGPVLTPKGAA